MTGISRRGFLGASAGALTLSAMPLGSTAGAQEIGPNGTLVILHLVGGVDGLSVLVPDGDDAFPGVRPSTAIAPTGEPDGAIPFVPDWGLHPALAPVVNAAGGQLAIVGGVGFDEGWPARTHVGAMRLLRRGRPGRGGRGWGTRVLQDHELSDAAAGWWGDSPTGILRGFGGERPPRGRDPLHRFGDPLAARRALATAYAGTSFAAAAATALAGHRADSTGADAVERGYPERPVGRRLAAAADWVRSDAAPRVIALEADGFDTHRAQGNGAGGVLATRLDEVARSLARFWDEIEPVRAGITVAVVSEFGRAIGENRIGGTNHGSGGVALVMDDGVAPGLHGGPRWPGAGGRFEGWPVTVDTRRVFVDVLHRRGFDVAPDVFPGFDVSGPGIGLF